MPDQKRELLQANDSIRNGNNEVCSVSNETKRELEETSNEFEDSCWDPYCERVDDYLEMSGPRSIHTLIDVSGCQTDSIQTNNNNNGNSKRISSCGSVSLDYDYDEVCLNRFAKFRDDLLIDTQLGASYKRGLISLRKTKSCPSTPFRSVKDTR